MAWQFTTTTCFANEPPPNITVKFAPFGRWDAPPIGVAPLTSTLYGMNKVGDTLLHTGTNEELIAALIEHGVEFIVIGGLAVSWYCADRQADDMDLLVNPTPENSARLSSALCGLPSVSACNADSFTKPGLQVPLKTYFYAELLTPRQDGLLWSQISETSVDAKLFHRPVRIASANTLIKLKEHAIASEENQRNKHLRDIELLGPYAV